MAQTPRHWGGFNAFRAQRLRDYIPATYIMEFDIRRTDLDACPLWIRGLGTLVNTGSKTIDGPVTLQLVIQRKS